MISVTDNRLCNMRIMRTYVHLHHVILWLPLALEVISCHHHLVYHMLNPNFLQSLAIIKEHCTVSLYHESQILSMATAQETNDRILKFLEEKYSFNCDYDEFFVILRKLIEIPQAMPIIDSFQKSMYLYRIIIYKYT